MDYTTKLVYQSNYWYNDGIKKATIRDMSGAIASLRRSLQYNRANVAAMNLLGLVYYGRGDVMEALVEWIISKNFQPHDNIANYYISKVQEIPGELAGINQAVKRYNQSLQYAAQNGEDLAIIQLKKAVAAHPTYVRAYQLLGLLYLHTEQYANARQMLRIAYRLDTTNELTLRYLHELNQVRKERAPDSKAEMSKKEQRTVTYNLGNETIIQPVSTAFKEHTGLHTVVNIGTGVLMGVLVMWFLIMPALNISKEKRVNKQTVAFSDQIETQKSQINALKTELETYRSTSEETENVQETAASTQESYETLMSIAEHYNAQDMGNDAMVDELLKIKTDSLGLVGKETYKSITDNLFPAMCEELYSMSQQNFEVANYETGITNLEKVMKMDQGYADGAAMLLLAQSYEKSGDQDKANIRYQKLIEKYPGTDAAGEAQKALDSQKSGKKTEDGDGGTSGTGEDGDTGDAGSDSGDVTGDAGSDTGDVTGDAGSDTGDGTGGEDGAWDAGTEGGDTGDITQ